jgi:hypothetical protein
MSDNQLKCIIHFHIISISIDSFRQQQQHTTNGVTTDKNNDILLKQLLKNMTAPNGRSLDYLYINNYLLFRSRFPNTVLSMACNNIDSN